MFSYSAYGLGIHSQLQLFELPVQEVDLDVSIRLGDIDLPSNQVSLPVPFLKLNPAEAVFAIPSVAKFRVNAGKEIVIDPEPGAEEKLLQGYLVGAAMAILLNQRGRLVLHASAVDLDGLGIAFLGAPGAGKSSTAASLMKRGHTFLVDDIAAIELKPGMAVLYPGFPQVKLAREAALSMHAGDSQLVYMDDLDDKLNFRLINNIQQYPIEVKKIYILGEDSHIEFQPLSPQQAVVELVRYSMPTSIVQMDNIAHFNKCVKLASLTEVYRLVRPFSLGLLPQVAARIEEHILLTHI